MCAYALYLENTLSRKHTGPGTYKSFGVLIASGAHPRMADFDGEMEFRGHGVAYCALACGELKAGGEKRVFNTVFQLTYETAASRAALTSGSRRRRADSKAAAECGSSHPAMAKRMLKRSLRSG